jgi:hypothetical protein
MSQRSSLDYLGWRQWEVKNGCLQHKQLNYRYYWEPEKLLLPLYGVTNQLLHGTAELTICHRWNRPASPKTASKPPRTSQNAILPDLQFMRIIYIMLNKGFEHTVTHRPVESLREIPLSGCGKLMSKTIRGELMKGAGICYAG